MSEITITVRGVSYPFPTFDTLTYGEARLAKQMTRSAPGANDGMPLGRFYEALEDGDPDALIAIAVIALKRGGQDVTLEELNDLNLNDIQIVVPEPEAPAGPLDSTNDGSGSESTGEPLSNEDEPSGT